jgi:hypothetical protein
MNTTTEHIKSALNNVEIEGLIKMFNDFMNEYEGRDENNPAQYDFFYCSSCLCSTDSANGKPIYFEGYKVDYLELAHNGLTYIVCEDENENRFTFEFNKYSGDFYLVSNN